VEERGKHQQNSKNFCNFDAYRLLSSYDCLVNVNCHIIRAVARLSEQTRQMSRLPKVRASKGGSGGMLPQKILKSSLSEMLFSASFHEIFLQNSISFKCKKARVFLCFQHFLYLLLGCVPDWHQVDFALLLYTPIPTFLLPRQQWLVSSF